MEIHLSHQTQLQNQPGPEPQQLLLFIFKPVRGSKCCALCAFLANLFPTQWPRQVPAVRVPSTGSAEVEAEELARRDLVTTELNLFFRLPVIAVAHALIPAGYG